MKPFSEALPSTGKLRVFGIALKRWGHWSQFKQIRGKLNALCTEKIKYWLGVHQEKSHGSCFLFKAGSVKTSSHWHRAYFRETKNRIWIEKTSVLSFPALCQVNCFQNWCSRLLSCRSGRVSTVAELSPSLANSDSSTRIYVHLFGCHWYSHSSTIFFVLWQWDLRWTGGHNMQSGCRDLNPSSLLELYNCVVFLFSVQTRFALSLRRLRHHIFPVGWLLQHETISVLMGISSELGMQQPPLTFQPSCDIGAKSNAIAALPCILIIVLLI